jgi:hypothetical protein
MPRYVLLTTLDFLGPYAWIRFVDQFGRCLVLVLFLATRQFASEAAEACHFERHREILRDGGEDFSSLRSSK